MDDARREVEVREKPRLWNPPKPSTRRPPPPVTYRYVLAQHGSTAQVAFMSQLRAASVCEKRWAHRRGRWLGCCRRLPPSPPRPSPLPLPLAGNRLPPGQAECSTCAGAWVLAYRPIRFPRNARSPMPRTPHSRPANGVSCFRPLQRNPSHQSPSRTHLRAIGRFRLLLPNLADRLALLYLHLFAFLALAPSFPCSAPRRLHMRHADFTSESSRCRLRARTVWRRATQGAWATWSGLRSKSSHSARWPRRRRNTPNVGPSVQLPRRSRTRPHQFHLSTLLPPSAIPCTAHALPSPLANT